jgi:hypothetical protein
MRVGEFAVRVVLGSVATEHLLPATSPNRGGLAGRQLVGCEGTDLACLDGCMPSTSVCCLPYVPRGPALSTRDRFANGCGCQGEAGTAMRDTTACP